MVKIFNSNSRYTLPVLILLGGFLIMFFLIASRKPPVKEQRESNGVLVQVIEVGKADRQVTVTGTGTVRPQYEFNLTPQVSGIVEWVHPDLAAGGSFCKGDTLLKIEAKDYLLAVQQAEAAVAQAQYQYDLEKANAEVALEEWQLMKSGAGDSGSDGPPDPLVLREPQLNQAQASYKSAQASLELARLNLSRTFLRAPYNCRVRDISVSPGQLISVSTPVASLYSTDIAEIDVGLKLADLAWIQIPGAPVKITLDTGDQLLEWNGTVDRSVGILDEIGRLAQVVVQVKDPFAVRHAGQPALNVGSFVHLSIGGKELQDVIVLPRSAVRENGTVWVSGEGNLLQIRSVEFARLTPEEALISSGIEAGEQVVVTSLTGAADGMKLRPQLKEEM